MMYFSVKEWYIRFFRLEAFDSVCLFSNAFNVCWYSNKLEILLGVRTVVRVTSS